MFACFNHEHRLVFSVPAEPLPDDVDAWLAELPTKEERRACEQAYRIWKPERDKRLQ